MNFRTKSAKQCNSNRENQVPKNTESCKESYLIGGAREMLVEVSEVLFAFILTHTSSSDPRI